MSLPSWISCPYCKSIEGPRRVGRAGVPENMIGSRIRTLDPDLFHCDECGSDFRSGGATRREAMGEDVSGEDETSG